MIPKGSKVGLMVAAADRDSSVFENADTVTFDWRPNRHIAMGYSIHRCVGAALTRAQLRIAAEELFSLNGDFVLTSEPGFSPWTHLGPSKLPVRFTACSIETAITPTHSGQQGVALTVAAIRPLARRVIELKLRAHDGATLPEWAAGAHIDFVLPGDVTRSYSLVDDSSDRGAWRVAVLHEAAGRGRSEMIHRMKVEDTVRAQWPRNDSLPQPAAGYHFFASGIGITPILSMIDAARAHGFPWRLDYVGRTREHLVYLDRVAQLSSASFNIASGTGRPDLAALLEQSEAETSVCACGSEGFLLNPEAATAATGRSFRAGWFAPKPGARQGAEGAFEAFMVRYERSYVDVAVLSGQSIIDACAEAGVTILSSCFEDTYGAYLSAVLQGVPDDRDSLPSLNRAEIKPADGKPVCPNRGRDA